MTIHHSVVRNSQANSAQDSATICEALDQKLLVNSDFCSRDCANRAVNRSKVLHHEKSRMRLEPDWEVKLRLSLSRFPLRNEWQDFGRLITYIRSEFGYTSRHVESNPLPPDGNDDAVSSFVKRYYTRLVLIERDNFGCVCHAA